MSTRLGRQTGALLRRHSIILLRYPLSSFFRLVVPPGLCILIVIHLQQTSDKDGASGSMKSETDRELSLALTFYSTIFNAFNLGMLLVRDKSTGLRSLMISMGLQRNSYYLANAIYFIASNMVSVLAIAIDAALNRFSDSQASHSVIVLMFVLFLVHLTAFVLVLSSFLVSGHAITLALMTLSFGEAFHSGVVALMLKVDSHWWPLILFTASISPYESIKIFIESHLRCKNCNETGLMDVTIAVNESFTLTVANVVSQPTHLIILAMLTWTIVALATLRWLDEVCPWQTDSAVKGPFFCMQKASGQSNQEFEDDSTRESSDFERPIAERGVGIHVHGITKEYEGVAAVDRVDLNVYRGETTLLLGRNGSGKSTLMDMVLGKLQPDSGSVVFKNGDCYSHSLSGFGVGYCPQTSVLDEYLSVKQHLELFTDIKAAANLSWIEKSESLVQTIHDIGLRDHTNKLPSELSGGMKRKLSLGMALVGDSSVLILDEPCSGLDPVSRRSVSKAIRRHRENRTVLLSTQHMEEADYLGDRIAIMRKGRIVCCGSSAYLNSLFRGGYKLRVECKASRCESVLVFIRKFYPKAKLCEDMQIAPPGQDDSNATVVIELLEAEKSTDRELGLVSLLEGMESNSCELHVKSFGLHSSSIEDVLLNLHEMIPGERGARRNHAEAQQRINTIVGATKIFEGTFATNRSLLQALLMKNLRTFNRNRVAELVMRIVIPMIVGFPAFAYWGESFDSFLLSLVVEFVYNPSREIESKFKIVQLTSNANFILYWLSQLITDLLPIFVVILIANTILATKLSAQLLVGRVTFHLLLSSAILLFSTAGALFAYILSHLLSNPSSSVFYAGLLYKAPRIVKTVLGLAESVASSDLSSLKWALKQFFNATLPTRSVLNIIKGFRTECYISFSPTVACLPSEGFSLVLIGYISLIAQIVLFSVVLFVLEMANVNFARHLRWLNICSRLLQSKANAPIELRELNAEAIVANEEAANVIADNQRNTTSLAAVGLSKSYVRATKVVQGLSFTVDRGECVSLLGANGASKSTILSMLIGELKPDRGRISANGHYSHSDISEYRGQLGYDPQATPEMSLSPVEAFTLVARLRLVDDSCVSSVVQSLLELLEITEHANKLMSKLSCGTRRKVALGMSVIGNPAVLALDDPTAGMDPTARRSVWRLLREFRHQKGSSMVIASHSMDEYEATCDRIAVIARGRLRCISSPSQLRAKFSQGCRIRVRLKGSLEAAALSTSSSASTWALTTHCNEYLDAEGHLARVKQPGPPKSIGLIALNLIGLLKSIVDEPAKLVDSDFHSATIAIKSNNFKRSIVLRLLREFNREHPQVSYSYSDSSLADVCVAFTLPDQRISSDSPRSTSESCSCASLNSSAEQLGAIESTLL